MANTLSVKPQTSLTAYLTGDAVKNQINKVVGGANGDRFISSLMSAVQANPTLQECSNASLVNAALLGYSLNLSPSPQLGYFYFVPFWDNDNTYDERGRIINKKAYAAQKNVAERSLPSVRAAQFQMGYRGYLQLAMRSGQYKKINTVEIKEGEFVSYNPLLEELKVNIIEDPDERMHKKTIGYYAMFEYLNGFRKEMYWTEGQMRAHAQRYSKSYKNGPWATDFDKMAAKTMLRQLLGHYGIMSLDMEKAFAADNGVLDENLNARYVDVTESPIENARAEIDRNANMEMIEMAPDPARPLQDQIPEHSPAVQEPDF
jgi:recombination protein RecT